jgi:hypothetical protein
MMSEIHRASAVKKRVLILGCIGMGFLVSACTAQTWWPKTIDLARFEPLRAEDRILDAPTVRLVVHGDAHGFCSRITGQAINKKQQPMACAYWNVPKNECTIVVPSQTATNYIGHELRHCFEGAYHP